MDMPMTGRGKKRGRDAGTNAEREQEEAQARSPEDAFTALAG